MDTASSTRRSFFKKLSALCASAALPIGFGRSVAIGAEHQPESDLGLCARCGATNDIDRIAAKTPVPTRLYCHNCGVNLISFRYDLNIQALSLNQESGKTVCLGESRQIDYVPFPNHDFLRDCGKSQLRISGIKF